MSDDEDERVTYSTALKSSTQFLCHFELSAFDQYGDEDKVECDVKDKTAFLATKWRIDLYPRSQNENGVDYASLVIDSVNSLDKRDFEGMKASYRVEVINHLKPEDSRLTEGTVVDDVADFDGYYAGVYHEHLIESTLLFEEAHGFLKDGCVTIKVHLEVFSTHLNNGREVDADDVNAPPLKRRRSLADDVLDLHRDPTTTADVTIIVAETAAINGSRSTSTSSSTSSGSGNISGSSAALSDQQQQQEHSFKAHKFILSARSDTFKSMFATNMRESRECTVRVTQFNVAVMKALIDFCYTDQCGQTTIENNALQLLDAAFYYQISALVDFCEEHLCSTLNVDNCIQLLSVANERDLLELKARAIHCVSKHAAALQAGVKLAINENINASSNDSSSNGSSRIAASGESIGSR